MGQISNVTTLRQKSINLNLNSFINKEFVFYFMLIKILKRLLFKKGVVVLNCTLNSSGSFNYIELCVFYKTQKVIKYRRKFNSKKKNVSFKHKLNLNALMFKFNMLKKSNLIKVINYNKKISKKTIKNLYTNFNKYLNKLFSRRFNFFFDFLKITALYLHHENLDPVYLSTLCEIFRVLTKKKHSQYIFFLKYLFTEMVNKKRKNTFDVLGIKLLISGKLKGKTRFSITRVAVGSLPINKVSANVSFSKMHCYTLYGAFGFKL
jgi:hypothetical protein